MDWLAVFVPGHTSKAASSRGQKVCCDTWSRQPRRTQAAKVVRTRDRIGAPTSGWTAMAAPATVLRCWKTSGAHEDTLVLQTMARSDPVPAPPGHSNHTG
eukprot:scaffold303429_cov45-Prasinocladus_malaysianus.AAC.1